MGDLGFRSIKVYLFTFFFLKFGCAGGDTFSDGFGRRKESEG